LSGGALRENENEQQNSGNYWTHNLLQKKMPDARCQMSERALPLLFH
jgi:hypothetical protein